MYRKLIAATLVAGALALPASIATPAHAGIFDGGNRRACRLVDRAYSLPRGSVTAYGVESSAYFAATNIALESWIERAENANWNMNRGRETRMLVGAQVVCGRLGF